MEDSKHRNNIVHPREGSKKAKALGYSRQLSLTDLVKGKVGYCPAERVIWIHRSGGPICVGDVLSDGSLLPSANAGEALTIVLSSEPASLKPLFEAINGLPAAT